MTRLVFAVAQHLHMTAGAVQNEMGVYELMCWSYLLNARPSDEGKRVGGIVLSVKDEIDAWG